MPNVCERIINNPESALGPCTEEQMADAVIAIVGMMSTNGYELIGQKAAQDEEIHDGLLSALERSQPE